MSSFLQRAHNFVMNNVKMVDKSNVHIQTQNINNIYKPQEQLLSPIKLTAPCTSQNFIGRETYLNRLRKYFSTKDRKRKIFLLYGMGGIGKTQICLKFKDEIQDRYVMSLNADQDTKILDRYAYIFWIDATSDYTILESARDIYKKYIKEPGMSFSNAVVLHWISSLEKEWLMIFDNADGSPTLVEGFLPPGDRGDFIITSRNPALRSISTPDNASEVTIMDEKAAINLFLKGTGLDASHVDKAKVIVTALHFIPLAVDQAAAYITAGKCGIENFMRVFEKNRKDMMYNEAFRNATKYERTVYGTWEISYNKIEEMRNNSDRVIALKAEYAIHFINICAFFHHDRISREIFERAAGNCEGHIEKFKESRLPTYLETNQLWPGGLGWDESIFENSIGILCSFSLIKRMTGTGYYGLHPLVQLWCQDRLSLSEKETWLALGRAILSSSISPDDNASVDDYTYERSISIHVRTIMDKSGTASTAYYDDVYRNFARVFKLNGRYDLEEKLRVVVLEQHQNVVGLDDDVDEDTLKCMSDLADCYGNQQKYAEMERLEIKGLELKKRVLGPTHPETMNSLGNLAQSYFSQGSYEMAEAQQKDLLEKSRTALGGNHPDTILRMSNLAATYFRRKKYTDAEWLQNTVIKASEKIHGAEHPLTLMYRSNLAATYDKQKKWKKSECLYQKIIEASTRVLGKEHPQTLTTMANVAAVYIRQNKNKIARTLLLDVLNTKYDAPHHITLLAMSNLAQSFYNEGKYSNAETIQRQLIQKSSEVYGSEHRETLLFKCDLILTLKMQKKWKDLKSLAEDTCKLLGRILGPSHHRTLAVATCLDMACRKLRQSDNVSFRNNSTIGASDNWEILGNGESWHDDERFLPNKKDE